MPSVNDIYQRLYERIQGALAHPLRGIIVDVPSDDVWNAQGGSRTVTVQVTPSGASYPRQYPSVPWNNLCQPEQMQGKPKPGDYVTLIFKGGSSEFPVITSYHPGPESATMISRANAAQPIVPAPALVQATKTPIAPQFTIDPFFSTGT